MKKQILLSHGGGGEEMNSLINDTIFKAFDNEILRRANDSAILNFPLDLDKNFDIICSALGVKKEQCVTLRQIHSTDIIIADESTAGMGFKDGIERKEADGIVTNRQSVVLVTFHADCVPLYFVDLKNKAIGMAHAGWRGTADKMAAKMLDKMKTEFGTEAEYVKAAVGPSIGPCCFQVDRPVVDIFEQNFDFADTFYLKKLK